MLRSGPVPELARLGRILEEWLETLLAYSDADRSSNGGVEAVNGLIELQRCIASGFRNLKSYRLRMLCQRRRTRWPHSAVTHLRSEEPVSSEID